MASHYLFVNLIFFILMLETKWTFCFDDDMMIEDEMRDYRPQQQSSRISVPRTAAAVLSSFTSLRRQQQHHQQQQQPHQQHDSSASAEVPAIVSPSASDQKPSRASLFFSGNNGGSGLLGGILGGGSSQRTILIPSGALTAPCCPCAGASVIPSASGALIAPGKHMNLNELVFLSLPFLHSCLNIEPN